MEVDRYENQRRSSDIRSIVKRVYESVSIPHSHMSKERHNLEEEGLDNHRVSVFVLTHSKNPINDHELQHTTNHNSYCSMCSFTQLTVAGQARQWERVCEERCTVETERDEGVDDRSICNNAATNKLAAHTPGRN